MSSKMEPTSPQPSNSLVLRSIPRDWYTSENPHEDPAKEAYECAVKDFNERLTEDECKRIWLRDKTDILQVQQAVIVAKAKYDSHSQQSKARKWLLKFSERVMHYSKIMDTLANHHPEYVALAWGAMKFLLMALLNHEELLSQLSKAFSQIAAALPRVNVKILLYPTDQIKHAVSTLYAYIIKFMQRAMNWYTEGRLRHIITAVFRPAPLRFKDLLDEIETCSQNIDRLAVGASQAEQRDMHLLLLEIKRTMSENQAANSRLFLDSRRRTCEIQFSQILSFTATASLLSPEESFRHCEFLSKRRRLRMTADAHPSWHSHKLREWAAAKNSSLILIKGSCLARHETKDFATDIVSLLREMKIPVVWTLSAQSNGDRAWRSPVEVLKQLVFQVLRINQSLLHEHSPALSPARFQSATTESDWFELLGSVLQGLEQIYIAVDAEILSREFSSQISWPTAFLQLFENLRNHCHKTIVKVIIVSFGRSPYLSNPEMAPLHNMTIKIHRDRRSGACARKKPSFRSASLRRGSEALRPFFFSETKPE